MMEYCIVVLSCTCTLSCEGKVLGLSCTFVLFCMLVWTSPVLSLGSELLMFFTPEIFDILNPTGIILWFFKVLKTFSYVLC